MLCSRRCCSQPERFGPQPGPQRSPRAASCLSYLSSPSRRRFCCPCCRCPAGRSPQLTQARNSRWRTRCSAPLPPHLPLHLSMFHPPLLPLLPPVRPLPLPPVPPLPQVSLMRPVLPVPPRSVPPLPPFSPGPPCHLLPPLVLGSHKQLRQLSPP